MIYIKSFNKPGHIDKFCNLYFNPVEIDALLIIYILASYSKLGKKLQILKWYVNLHMLYSNHQDHIR